MPSLDDIKTAFGCLSTVFPQYIAKELANLSDQVAAAIQGFTDPLAAIGDINLDSLISNAAAITDGDTFGNLESVAVGLGAQYTKREAGDLLSELAAQYPSVSKRIQAIGNLSSQVVTSTSMMMSLFPDVPYVAAQRMCSTIVTLTDLKRGNLECLRTHVVQLINAILVLAKTSDTYMDETFNDLVEVQTHIEAAKLALTQSQRFVGTSVSFDSQAFERARTQLLLINNLLTPDKDGTTIADLADIVEYGSVTTAEVTKGNRKLVLLVIPSLLHLIEVEISAVVSQVQVINFFITQLGSVISSYQKVGGMSRVQQQRARAIAAIQSKLVDLSSRIDLAVSRRSLRAVSGDMLLWSSRVRTILATMDQVKQLQLQEGSIEGPDKAFALQTAFTTLLTGLTEIENSETTVGIEDPTLLQERVLAIVAGAKRVVQDIESGRTNASRLATLHALASTVATAQISRIEDSIVVAARQNPICQTFAAIPIGFGDRYDQMMDSMRQMGLDRGVDLLGAGAFEEFMSSDLDALSYLGVAIKCLEHGINGTDDFQTRAQIATIRDDLIGQQSSLQIAAADSADQGRSRYLDKLKDQIGVIQQNGKTVEGIVSQLKGILQAAGEDVKQSLAGLAALNGFAGNIDHLAVGAGGRLASTLEDASAHANGGVVACD